MLWYLSISTFLFLLRCCSNFHGPYTNRLCLCLFVRAMCLDVMFSINLIRQCHQRQGNEIVDRPQHTNVGSDAPRLWIFTLHFLLIHYCFHFILNQYSFPFNDLWQPWGSLGVAIFRKLRHTDVCGGSCYFGIMSGTCNPCQT